MSVDVKEIAFSCYPVTDFERARKFYEGVLGLKSTMIYGAPGGMQWGEYDIGSGTISIGCSPQFKPSSDGCSVALEVGDFEASIAHLRSHNVAFKMEPFETPGCFLAIINDPDGNTILIHKRKARG